MKNSRRAGLFILAAVIAVACQPSSHDAASSQPQSTLKQIVSRGEVRVGYLPWNPTVIKDLRTGQLTGIYPDMVGEIAKALKVKVSWQETNLANFAAGLSSKQFDFCVGPTFVTIPRAVAVAFTVPVNYVGNSGVVSAGGDFKPRTIDDLKKPGLRIAVLQGQAMEEYCRRVIPQANVLVISGGDLTAPLVAVSAGRADVGLMNSVTVASYVAGHPEVTQVLGGKAQVERLPLAWSTRHEDSDLQAFLDASIMYMKANGSLQRYQNAYPIKLLYDTPELHE